MKTRYLPSLTSLALAALVGSPAQATMIAGWDFSQYFGDGFMSTDQGGSFANSLAANYSDLDPTNGLGVESAAFGRMYVDGSFGSTHVDAGSGVEEFLPSAALGGSLLSNQGAPGGFPFDSYNELLDEGGQLSAESLAMIAAQTSVVVFEADLSSAGLVGSDWSVSFGARMFSGASSLGIAFSSNGVDFTVLPAVNLSNVDTQFTVALGADTTGTAYVRFTFNPSGPNQPLIDNVAFSAGTLEVPEPSTALLGSLGLIGLAVAGRRRSAARD